MTEMKKLIIIGGGPAGLTAAYEAIRQGITPVVFEKNDRVGGIARTETYKGYHFDVGGHRFFSKFERVNILWQEIMGKDFIKVPRRSRIFFDGRFFNYPLQPVNALYNLGLWESFLIIMSFFAIKISPYPEEDTFEEWVSNRFGKRLYETFFKNYTEKVWGISCKEIRADWAAQRIKGLSLTAAIYNALFGIQKSKTLIDEFDYPSKGPGMMWERFKEKTEKQGGHVLMHTEVTGLKHENGRITTVTYMNKGNTMTMEAQEVISSSPITHLVDMLNPKPPEAIIKASQSLTYRAFIIVVLFIDEPFLFSDQWIYIHTPNVKVGRIQNFKNWSAAMVPDPKTSSIGMEYFCNEGDELWMMSDREISELAARELVKIKLSRAEKILDSSVIRQPKAYPVYNHDYAAHLGTIREYLKGFENLQTVGRNGMHRYNNMDHSMLTAMMAVENINGARHNLWTVNEEEEYLEEKKSDLKLRQLIPEKVLTGLFARMDKLGFATALGSVLGLNLFFATLWLTIHGVSPDLPDLSFLSQYFLGYTISFKGALIAFGYTFLYGFLIGWTFAYIRNLLLSIYLFYIKKKAEILSFQDFMVFFR